MPPTPAALTGDQFWRWLGDDSVPHDLRLAEWERRYDDDPLPPLTARHRRLHALWNAPVGDTDRADWEAHGFVEDWPVRTAAGPRMALTAEASAMLMDLFQHGLGTART